MFSDDIRGECDEKICAREGSFGVKKKRVPRGDVLGKRIFHGGGKVPQNQNEWTFMRKRANAEALRKGNRKNNSKTEIQGDKTKHPCPSRLSLGGAGSPCI